MATVVSIVACLDSHCSSERRSFHEAVEEHPLQWLQPTPEISTPAALYLPPFWRQNRVDGEASSGTSRGSHSFLCDVLSDVSTSMSEHGDLSQEQCWADVGMDRVSAGESVTSPPLLTPRISSLPTPPPPPPYVPLEEVLSSPLFLQTPSPTYARATSMSLQQFGARGAQAPQDLAPTLLATMGSFASLSAWSATCDDSSRQVMDKPRMVGLAQAGKQVETVMAGLPMAAELPVVSAGSALHDLGTCKPCAFVHRAGGCADGSACKFCHLCTPGEKKRRQKHKFERIQQRRLRRAGATSASSAETTGERCSSLALSPGTPTPR